MFTTNRPADQGNTSDGVAELLGHVHAINGPRVTVALLTAALNGPYRQLITVGKFLKIQNDKWLLVGAVTDVSFQNSSDAGDRIYRGAAHVDLIGEFDRRGDGEIRFHRGVTDYPTIGDTVVPLTNSELHIIFDGDGETTINIGTLQQDSAVGASVEIDEMLSKHFAVLGSTGVGKSSAVAYILLQTMQARPDLRIFLLDAHNEYHRCFGERAYIISRYNLRLPFWLFNFEEIIDVIFTGRPGLTEEIEILFEIIPLAKANYGQYRAAADRPGIKKLDMKSLGYTVDTPVPYRLADLLAMADERMGKLENRSSRMTYHKLITRIETVSNDSRYAFMFENANVGGDTMAESISQLFRLPADGKPVTIMQLAGFPAEVVDAVVSVLTRLAFDFGLWSDGADPLLFVCEEAHKYASVDPTAGFAPAHQAISRIAKEGRKYGVYFGLVTQRPAELDPTIISQCGTVFAMRMSNDRDQALLRSAVPDTAANLIAFVPSLATRQAVAFGAGIPLPTRLTFAELPPNLVPKMETSASELHSGSRDLSFVSSVLERWRNATANRAPVQGETPRPIAQPSTSQGPISPAPARAPDQNRFGLLKRPVADPFVEPRPPESTPTNR